ncbi:MAG: hypothetical protein H0U18_10020 [Pyrinomonadaceae bacterium]|nr:hypothetical protein [Pyrinomonadaceae bacterium]
MSDRDLYSVITSASRARLNQLAICHRTKIVRVIVIIAVYNEDRLLPV